MVDKNEMGMTNKQFQGFVRLVLGWIKKSLEKTPDSNLEELCNILQSMLEDN